VKKIKTIKNPSLKDVVFKPIGFFQSQQIFPYQAGRQPDESSEPGLIILNPKSNFEQALTNLEQCSHIWIVYVFHHNSEWKPLVQTPRSKTKIGVFATRAPYRPNPIGMTAVKILKIEGLAILVDKNDLLDGTPILDIKPYHPESDIIKGAQIQWLQSSAQKSIKMKVRLSPMASDQIDFLDTRGLKELKTFAKRQLEYDPTDKTKTRVKDHKHYFTLAYRTWRIDFIVTDNIVSVLQIHSGYTSQDLESNDDKYNDKNLHRIFNKEFN
jgi:tRNA (adenine37-N6)-methyltransferase